MGLIGVYQRGESELTYMFIKDDGDCICVISQ